MDINVTLLMINNNGKKFWPAFWANIERRKDKSKYYRFLVISDGIDKEISRQITNENKIWELYMEMKEQLEKQNPPTG